MNLIIALGSNIGDKNLNLDNAIQQLEKSFGKSIDRSRVYSSEPHGEIIQPDFYNMVIQFDRPNESPQSILKTCLNIENNMGRKRLQKWGPRNIDIDILYIDELKINENNLTIPHPHINERSFVVLPLQDLDCYDQLYSRYKYPDSFSDSCYPI